MLRPGRPLLVGVSGGPDSVALARLLTEWSGVARKACPDGVVLGHVHHGLRSSADDDLAFVERFAAERGVRCLTHRAGPGSVASHSSHSSPEQVARRIRFTQFSTWARAQDLGAVLLAHHMDDQAETVLLRAVRGSGVRGLAALARSRPLENTKGAVVLRPLLGWRRAEILEYLKERGQGYCRDPTNEDTAIPRNRVRHDVLPVLDMVQRGAIGSLSRLASQASEFREELRELGVRALTEARDRESSSDGVVCLCLESLRRWTPGVLREALQLAWEEVAGAVADPLLGPGSSGASTQALIDGLRVERTGARNFELGAGVQTELRYGRLWLARARGQATVLGDVPLDVERGTPTRWGRWVVSVGTTGGTVELRSSSPGFEELVDADRVLAAGTPVLRSRRIGDRLQPLGAPGAKALKEFFRERRVRPVERDQVPLVVAGGEIVWVVGHRIAHAYRVRAETRRVWTLQASEDGVLSRDAGY